MKRRRTCSSGCDADADCPGVDTCLQAQVSPASDLCPESPGEPPPPGSVVGVCVPNETAFPCEDPSGCTSGICLTPPQVVPWTSPQSVCTMVCTNDLKCPVGYRCGQVGGISETVCVEEAQVNACPSGDALTCGGVCPVPPNRDEADLVVCLNGFNHGMKVTVRALVLALLIALRALLFKFRRHWRSDETQCLYPFCRLDLSTL